MKRPFVLSVFLFIDASVCPLFPFPAFRIVDFSFCRCFDISMLYSADVSICRRNVLSMFWPVTTATGNFVSPFTGWWIWHALTKKILEQKVFIEYFIASVPICHHCHHTEARLPTHAPILGYLTSTYTIRYGPLTRYVKLRVAHAPGMLGNIFAATACWPSRHASWHVRDACAVMHVAIAN